MGDVLGLASAGLERAHHHLAGVGADAYLERRLSLSAHAVSILPYVFLHSQGGIECTLRMVLVGYWSTEERENAVAGGLHDISAVAADSIDHQF
jgi:hypothetical protein